MEMSKEKEHIEKIRKEKFWLDEKGQLSKENPLIDDLINSIARLSESLYSKDTHFIFELIQNAEDNEYYKGTEPSISFRLVKADPTNTPNSLGALIVQNNEIGFSTDNVDAICAIGKTTKNKLQGYIGEKGIGFKSVFRITTIPHIFSNGYQFCFPEKDEKTSLGYIVPRWIKDIPHGIDPKQTTIILPLNKPDFGYERIEGMLQDIEPETILFLSKLKEIQIRTDSGDDLTILKDDKKSPRIHLLIEGIKQGKSYSDVREFLLFNQSVDRPPDVRHEKRIGINKRDVTVAFPADNNKDSMGKIFAYLPVRSDTGFPFLVNADFILPSSREDIQDVSWNRWLMKCLANLLANKLPLLKEKNLLTVQLLEALAKRMNELDESSMFYPIVEAVRRALQDHELLPADDGTFVSARNAKLARGAELRKLLTHDKLRKLLQSDDYIKWLSGEITQDRTPELRSYLMIELDVEEIRPETFIELLTDEFLQAQTDTWIIQFYNFLGNDRSKLWKKSDSALRKKKILRLEDNSHVIPFQYDGRPSAYLPSSSQTNFPIIKKNIFKDKGAADFLRSLGLFEPDLFAEVIEFVLPKYSEGLFHGDFQENIEDLRKISKVLNTPLHTKSQNSIGKLKILLSKLGLDDFLEYFEKQTETDKLIPVLLNMVLPSIKLIRAINGHSTNYRIPKDVYLNSDDLHMYFDDNSDIWFVDASYPEDLKPLFKKLSVNDQPRVERKSKNDKGHVVIRASHGWHKRGLNGFDPDIKVDGLEFALTHPTIEKSMFIWNQIAIPNSDCIRGIVESSSRQTYENSEKKEQISQNFGLLLRDCQWLPDKQGNFHKPSEIMLDDLPKLFDHNEELANQLGMKKDVVAKLAEEAGISQDTINIAKELENHPELLEEFRKKIRPVASDKESTETETDTDTDKICYKDELQKSFNRPGESELQEQITDNGKVRNPGRRRDKSSEAQKDSIHNEPKPEERRKETIRTILEGPNEQVREYLFQFYDGKCQICGKTFPERDGKPFFIANYIVPKKHGRFVDTPANAICLCADHFAKWQHGAVEEVEDIIGQIENFKTESEGGSSKPILRIKLCGEECKINYKEKHFLDLQALIKASKNEI